MLLSIWLLPLRSTWLADRYQVLPRPQGVRRHTRIYTFQNITQTIRETQPVHGRWPNDRVDHTLPRK